jgi:hypothetical protein
MRAHCGKRHLLRQHQHQRLEQQCETVELADPFRLDQPHRAIGQAHARHPHLQIAFVLKKIQVAQSLDLRVVHWVLTGEPGVGEATSCEKVHSNRQLSFGRIKVETLHVPRCLDSQGGFKELIRHCSVCLAWLVAAFCRTSHVRACRFKAPQGFAAPGSRPPLTRTTTHSDFKRGKN